MTLSSPLSIHHNTLPMTDPTIPMLNALVILTWTKPIVPSCLRFRHDMPKKLDLHRFILQTFTLYHDHFYPTHVYKTNTKACLMTIDPYFPLHIAASSTFPNFRHSKRKRKFSWLNFIEAFRRIKKTHPRTISLLFQVPTELLGPLAHRSHRGCGSQQADRCGGRRRRRGFADALDFVPLKAWEGICGGRECRAQIPGHSLVEIEGEFWYFRCMGR